MKTLTTATICLILTLPLFAQVDGRVLNEEGQPVPFANVLLLNAYDSTLVTGSLTEVDGVFHLDAKLNGSFVLSIKVIGYESWYSHNFTNDENQSTISFGELTLSEYTEILDGIQVLAQKLPYEQTMEGTTINVESSMMSTGSTALQLVERSPRVVLDQRNNSLSLNGQSGTLIMINGRPVRMAPAEVINLLSSMSADNLEKIELLTNPSAKYDADGTAGIINLIIKKSEDQGTNGSISLTGGYGWGPKEAASLNFNHRNESVNYYGSYSFNHDNTFSDWRGVGNSVVPILGGYNEFDFTNNTEHHNISHNTMAGIEKESENGILLGANVTYNHFSPNTNIFNHGEYTFENDSLLDAGIRIDADGNSDNLNTTLFLEKELGANHKVSFDADYILYENQSPTVVQSVYLDESGEETQPDNEIYANGNRGKSNTRINIGVTKIDYQGNLADNIRLESGIKGTYATTNNNARIDRLVGDKWVADERNIASLEIDEKIGAAYAIIHISPDSLTDLTAGVRYEYWNREFTEKSLNRNFGRFFPSMFLTRKLTSFSSLQLVYNRRITRPGYVDLSSNLTYNSPASVFTGNPLLKPAISDNLRMAYQLNGISFSLVYTKEKNPIARYQIKENEQSDLVAIAPQNVDFIKNIGIQANIPLDITDWWSFNAGGTASARRFKLSHTVFPIQKKYLAYNLYANQNFTLPCGFSLELSGWYTSRHYNGSIELHGFGMLNFGVKKKLNKDQGTIQFTVSDLLQSMTIKSIGGALTREAFDSTFLVKYQPESTNNRIFRLTYSRSFGSSKIKARKQRQLGSKDEKSRVN